ncbi:unnamed protein product [Effrenium voratum]|uniref:Uncharacterized protein n=1 Tax=Effrenium voratum TaxID=2562239 RepID=A0AA36NC80_9DINO|nr:unnamed protein product [Effrenium voratum]
MKKAKAFSSMADFPLAFLCRPRAAGPSEGDAQERKRRLGVEEPLHFDLPRRLTKQERQEVREELSTALSALSEVQAVPKRAQEIAPAELRLRTKVPLISTELRVGAGPVELARVLQLLMEAFDAAELELKERGRFISGEYRQMLVEETRERRAWQQPCAGPHPCGGSWHPRRWRPPRACAWSCGAQRWRWER